jgi:uncharacterized coiled-coil protein SlyX
MPRKPLDPVLDALYEKMNKAQEDFERHYTRFLRAFNRMEKTRTQLRNLHKRITKHKESKE